MQNQPTAGKSLTTEQRNQLEADYTYQRLYELSLEPVRGNFDAAHLKEVNRRIFQDLPGMGFDVTPGEFRKPVPDGLDWMKQRGLSISVYPPRCNARRNHRHLPRQINHVGLNRLRGRWRIGD
jgi:cell filamentation protein